MSAKRKRTDVKNEVKDEDKFEDDDDAPMLPQQTRKTQVVKGEDCPYLDTISRQSLDFDFEKCCSVSLSHVNVYACLICGMYFQGRGSGSHAHTHSVEDGHQIYMKLDTGKVYCLPDNYEVEDHTLADIRRVLDPQYAKGDISGLNGVKWARTLDAQDYMPGLVGLNNMKNNDYANVVIQALVRVDTLRDFFLDPSNYAACKAPVVRRYGELVRKVWNPAAFKGQVSPHEFLQAAMEASGKRFTLEQRSDPAALMTWLLNELHVGLTGGKRKGSSAITRCFQGRLQITTLAGTGKAADSEADVVDSVPFLQLALDLPARRLFEDTMEKNIIPQVPIFQLLKKYDGETIHDDLKLGRRKFKITSLPRYLLLSMKRFTKNRFFVEKNNTIVNFPIKNLELRDSIPVPSDKRGEPVPSKYDLLATVTHEGEGQDGPYRVYVHRRAENKWYEAQNLRIQEVMPDAVAISEAYIQVYEQQRPAR